MKKVILLAISLIPVNPFSAWGDPIFDPIKEETFVLSPIDSLLIPQPKNTSECPPPKLVKDVTEGLRNYVGCTMNDF
jgi:hypothetical protein